MRFSPILAFYQGASAVAGVAARPYLEARARNGKEDPARLSERFGYARENRPTGRLVWLHGASVGESGVALHLAEAMGLRDLSLSFLITTGTLTSAERVAQRLPPRTRHAFAPLDRADCVRRFLENWRPDLGVFVESELWPNLILQAERAGVTLALVNARMSPRTLERWRKWDAAGERLARAFKLVLAADTRTAQALGALRGETLAPLGNLKLAADAPNVDVSARATLERAIGLRPVWVAASTHAGEDEIVIEAHRKLRADFPDALCIIAPRHPERGEAIASLSESAPRRSLGHDVGNHAFYVADTIGELGLFYAVAPASLVAGSLLSHLKGHNPAEPAKLGSVILTGAHVESFEDVFAALFAAHGATRVRNADDLAASVAHFWRDDAARAEHIAAASAVVESGAAALDETVAQLAALLPASAYATA